MPTVILSLFIIPALLNAAQSKEARVTQRVNDVKLLSEQVPPRSALLGDAIGNGMAVRSGRDSRSELTFSDETIARLGANTIVTFTERTLNLGEGAMLFQIPKGARTAEIKIAAITVSSRDATGIVERHAHFYIKFLLLEGEARVSLTDRIGESLLMHAGQILITKPDASALPDPAYFDIARVMRTCLLVREFRPLPSLHSIELEEQKQADLITTGTYIPSNLVIFGRGTLVNLVNPAPSGKSGASSTAQSTPGR